MPYLTSDCTDRGMCCREFTLCHSTVKPVCVFLPSQGPTHCHQSAGGKLCNLGGMRGFGRAASLYCSPPETSVGCRDTTPFSSRFKVASRLSSYRSGEQKILHNRHGDSIPVQN